MKNKKKLKHTIASLVLATTLASTTTGCNSEDNINKEVIALENNQETESEEQKKEEIKLPKYLKPSEKSDYYIVTNLEEMLKDLYPEYMQAQDALIKQFEEYINNETIYVELTAFEKLINDTEEINCLDIHTFKELNFNPLLTVNIEENAEDKYLKFSFNEYDSEFSNMIPIKITTTRVYSDNFVATETSYNILYSESSDSNAQYFLEEESLGSIINRRSLSFQLKSNSKYNEYELNIFMDRFSGEYSEKQYKISYRLIKRNELDEDSTSFRAASYIDRQAWDKLTEQGIFEITDYLGQNGDLLLEIFESIPNLEITGSNELRDVITGIITNQIKQYTTIQNKWYDEKNARLLNNSECYKVTDIDKLLKSLISEELSEENYKVNYIKEELAKIGNVELWIDKYDIDIKNNFLKLFITSPNLDETIDSTLVINYNNNNKKEEPILNYEIIINGLKNSWNSSIEYKEFEDGITETKYFKDDLEYLIGCLTLENITYRRQLSYNMENYSYSIALVDQGPVEGDLNHPERLTISFSIYNPFYCSAITTISPEEYMQLASLFDTYNDTDMELFGKENQELLGKFLERAFPNDDTRTEEAHKALETGLEAIAKRKQSNFKRELVH